MIELESTRLTKMIVLAAAAAVVLAAAVPATAQDREDRWEITFGTFYQLGASLDFDSGSTMDTKDDWGLTFGGAYNFTDQFALNLQFQWAGVGYNADVVDDVGDISTIWGSYDSFVLAANAVYYFTDGKLAPYVGGGIGWTFIDTNIPSGPPSTGCWWDPWWGWVCTTNYPTHTANAFSYQASLGLRYEFNYSTFLRLNYTSQWLNLSHASGTPRFDVIGLDFGWMF